jgi:hypothetical protein
MDGTLAIAASGLAAGAAWLDRIASAVVMADVKPAALVRASTSNAGATPSITYQPLTTPLPYGDPAMAFADQSLALASYRASAALFRAAENMNKVMLDIVA